MKYDNRMKGWITQTLFKVLLEDAGYAVVPFGHEEVVREINQFPEEFFKTADMPRALYKMPDFIVVNTEKKKVYVFEVKYRKSITNDILQELHETLLKQVLMWSPIYLLLYIGIHSNKETPANYIKVIKIGKDDANNLVYYNKQDEPKKWEFVKLNFFHRIQDIFCELKDKEKAESLTLTKIIPMIKAFNEIDKIDHEQREILKQAKQAKENAPS